MSQVPSPRVDESAATCPRPEGEVTVQVRTPCRLHFGMFSFGRVDVPQFGGVGLMVEPPRIDVTFRSSQTFAVRGDHANRAREFVAAAMRSWELQGMPGCEIDVQSPQEHSGLGVGTQLGLSIAAGLRRFLKLPELPLELLAASVGRGKRSAIGTHGFRLGGLIVDPGKSAGETIAKVQTRIATPEEWRFVLIRAPNAPGLAGEPESAAFARLPAVPEHVTQELWRITNDDLLPAVEAVDAARFGEAVYRFGRLAGECFAAAQGGPFASTQIAAVVEAIRDYGVAGVGQSSWGPTVFAIVGDDQQANDLVKWLHEADVGRGCETTIARPNNSGAVVKS